MDKLKSLELDDERKYMLSVQVFYTMIRKPSEHLSFHLVGITSDSQ